MKSSERPVIGRRNLIADAIQEQRDWHQWHKTATTTPGTRHQARPMLPGLVIANRRVVIMLSVLLLPSGTHESPHRNRRGAMTATRNLAAPEAAIVSFQVSTLSLC